MPNGTILYTQYSVAFPSLSPRERELDELNVSISGRNGSIRFAWVDLSGYPTGALKVESFSDSIGVLSDARIGFVVRSIGTRRRHNRDVQPAKVIELLEDQGAIPSHYHVRGLLDLYPGEQEKARLQALYERAKRFE